MEMLGAAITWGHVFTIIVTWKFLLPSCKLEAAIKTLFLFNNFYSEVVMCYYQYIH